MNALDTTLPAAPRAVAPVHPTHKFRLLLRRELWEHKGGFLWAPLIAGGIHLLLSLMAIIFGEVMLNRVPDHAKIDVAGGSFSVNGLDLGMLTDKMSPEHLQEMGQAIDVALYMAGTWPLVVLAFVAFFYCLGCLYDDRKDRSVLFWKSLPVSDSETVLSKVASVTLVAPVIAALAALATMLGSLAIWSVVVMFHGGNPATLLWGPASPLSILATMIAYVPVYALWALPTVGWLMLCSAWARSKPFLWAIMIPLFAGIFVSWFDLMQLFDLDSSWFWRHVIGRGLLGLIPGSWMGDIPMDDFSPISLTSFLSVRSMYSVFATPQMWLGAVAGAAMIFGAIRLRRWRDEG
ncbi:hypothetical protein [Lysobacter sp. F60174L2]|uniref:hypothetical protein n=1 Tax=Lysobacter sp. F60174L2 TaxID=3459295 RepID=UPI00403D95DD